MVVNVLSPIMSNDSSSSAQDFERLSKHRSSENYQSENQFEQSQEELDSESDEDDQVLENYIKSRQELKASQGVKKCSAASAATTSGSFSSAESGPSLALQQQYLFSATGGSNSHSKPNSSDSQASSNQHLYQANSAGAKFNLNRKKFKQFIQSIPLPVVAIGLITAFILCLLLSECKSSQVSNPLIVSRVDGQQQQQQDDFPAGEISAQTAPLPQSLALLQQREQPAQVDLRANSSRDERAVGDNSPDELEAPKVELLELDGSPAAGSRQLLRQQQQLAAIKREYISNLLLQHQLKGPHLQQQHKRHSLNQNAISENNQPQPASGLDSLAAMLFGAAGSSEQQQAGPSSAAGGEEQRAPAAEAFLDGDFEQAPATRQQLRHSQQVQATEPAHLRAQAPLEVEFAAASDQQARIGSNKNQYTNTNNYNHHHQPRQHQQQQQQQQQQLYQRPNYNSNQIQQNDEQLSGSGKRKQQHGRKFDAFQIHCNNTDEGFERFACPSPDSRGRYKCIEDREFCDGYFDCPGEEDEERINCMYYKLFISHIDILTNTVLSWMKKQSRQINAQQQQQHQQHYRFDTT